MPKRALMLLIVMALGFTVSILTFRASAAPKTWRVPTDFATIQGAIDSANPGDTVFVYNGTYNERIVIPKSLTVIGQGSEIAIIDGGGLGTVVNITASGVSLSNFTIRNGGPGPSDSGINLFLVSACSIFANKITNNNLGILVSNSSGNTIYHNNFVNNALQASLRTSGFSNSWDNGYPSGGNYWSDYTGLDAKRGPNQDQSGTDGIIDSRPGYNITADNVDRYPFKNYWHPKAVKNLNSGLIYGSIQEAIDASETSSGNTIVIYEGIFYENVVVDKKLGLVGENVTDTIVDGGGVGTVMNVVANGVWVTGLTLRNSGPNALDSAILVDNASQVKLTGNVMTSSSVGIYLTKSYRCIIEGNSVLADNTGIDLELSHENTLRANIIKNQAVVGLTLRYSNTNIVDQNTVRTTRDGVRLENSFNNQVDQNMVVDIASYALLVLSSSNNRFRANTVAFGYIGLRMDNGGENLVAGNEISNNRVGVYLISSSNNTIYYNNFIENVPYQALIDPPSYLNSWNDSYPVGGNFWRSSDPSGNFTGADKKSGPYQNETGGDGLGDTPFTPYTVSPENTDNFPQMQAVSLTTAVDIHDVSIRNVTVSENRTYPGRQLNITVLASNDGNFTETFVVTAYYDASVIGAKGVSALRPRSGLNLTFVWNTVAVSPGRYVISANATTVPGEDNFENNQFVGSNVTVAFYRDVAVTNATISYNTIYRGAVVNITAVVSNMGNVSETVTVKAFYEENLIGSRIVDALAPHANASLIFAWNTSSVTPCRSYTITVRVDPVPEEAVLENNALSAGQINMRIAGDTNGDKVVNILDLAAIGVRFGSKTGDPRYDLTFDLNRDGFINIVDIALAALNWGRTCQ